MKDFYIGDVNKMTATYEGVADVAAPLTMEALIKLVRELPPLPAPPAFIISVEKVEKWIAQNKIMMGEVQNRSGDVLYGVRVVRVLGFYISEGHPLYKYAVAEQKGVSDAVR